MRVFITGGTGLVGSRLIAKLLERQDRPVLLTRRADHARKTWDDRVDVVEGDPSVRGGWMEELSRCDSAVNLVGEGIFNRRWNVEFKETLRRSRIDSTINVAEALAKQPARADGSPKVLVSASAIGYYGPHGDEELNENSPPAGDFMGQLCVDWEKAAGAATQAGVRTSIIRIGVVLDAKGGALQKMLPPFKMFVGGPIGSGRQYMSWIHHEDLVGLILFALDHSQASGPFNATAPNPVTNKDFSKALGTVIGRPAFFPTPGFMLRLGLGEVADVITKGQRVLPDHAQKMGYVFQFETIDAALKEVLK